MLVIFIAAPFRGANDYERKLNCDRAEALQLAVMREGMWAYCPHNNTRHFQDVLPDAFFLEGNLEMIKRHKVDALLMSDDWAQSEGACNEWQCALKHGIPVRFTLAALCEWRDTQEKR